MNELVCAGCIKGLTKLTWINWDFFERNALRVTCLNLINLDYLIVFLICTVYYATIYIVDHLH